MKISSFVCLDGVQETHDVGVARKKLMPRSDGLETQEQKIPDDVFVVMVALVQTSYDMCHTQLLFGVLEEGDEGLFAAISQLGACHRHVETRLPQYGGPGG